MIQFCACVGGEGKAPFITEDGCEVALCCDAGADEPMPGLGEGSDRVFRFGLRTLREVGEKAFEPTVSSELFVEPEHRGSVSDGLIGRLDGCPVGKLQSVNVFGDVPCAGEKIDEGGG